MLSGQRLGHGEQWPAEVGPGEVRLFSILPYEVRSLNVTLKAGNFARGDEVQAEVRLDTGGQPAERHVIALEVRQPDGQAVRCLARSPSTQAGRAGFQFHWR